MLAGLASMLPGGKSKSGGGAADDKVYRGVAKETEDCVRQEYYRLPDGAKVPLRPPPPPSLHAPHPPFVEKRFPETRVRVEAGDTMRAVAHLAERGGSTKGILVHLMANPAVPGGCWDSAKGRQEEDLVRRSTLCAALRAGKHYYPLADDSFLLLQDITVFRAGANGGHDFLESPLTVDFVAVPEEGPKGADAAAKGGKGSDVGYDRFLRRLDTLMRGAVEGDYTKLVLAPLGAPSGEAMDGLVRAHRAALEWFAGFFETVVYVVPEQAQKTLKVFRDAFDGKVLARGPPDLPPLTRPLPKPARSGYSTRAGAAAASGAADFSPRPPAGSGYQAAAHDRRSSQDRSSEGHSPVRRSGSEGGGDGRRSRSHSPDEGRWAEEVPTSVVSDYLAAIDTMIEKIKPGRIEKSKSEREVGRGDSAHKDGGAGGRSPRRPSKPRAPQRLCLHVPCKTRGLPEDDKERTKHDRAYMHVCLHGKSCDRSKCRDPEAVHLDKPDCKYGAKCRDIQDPVHRLRYHHEGLWDFMLLCRYGKSCRGGGCDGERYMHDPDFYDGKDTQELLARLSASASRSPSRSPSPSSFYSDSESEDEGDPEPQPRPLCTEFPCSVRTQKVADHPDRVKHDKEFVHICLWGQSCKGGSDCRDPSALHLTKPACALSASRCPHGDDPGHRLRYHHPGDWDTLLPCKYEKAKSGSCRECNKRKYTHDLKFFRDDKVQAFLCDAAAGRTKGGDSRAAQVLKKYKPSGLSDDVRKKLRDAGPQSLRGMAASPVPGMGGHAGHCFKKMLHREKTMGPDWAVFYHSYPGAPAIMYEVQAAIAKTLFFFGSEYAALPRILLDGFKRIPDAKTMMARFPSWPDQDHNPEFKQVGICCSTNIHSDPEAPPVSCFTGGYAASTLSLTVLADLLKRCGAGLGGADVGKLTKGIVDAAAESGLDCSSFGGPGSASGCSGHLLQIFIWRTRVDEFVYASQPMGVPDHSRMPGGKFSAYLNSGGPVTGQGRITCHPSAFMRANTVRMYTYSADPTFHKNRRRFQEKLTALLEPVLGHRGVRRKAAEGVYGGALPDWWKDMDELCPTDPDGGGGDGGGDGSRSDRGHGGKGRKGDRGGKGRGKGKGGK